MPRAPSSISALFSKSLSDSQPSLKNLELGILGRLRGLKGAFFFKAYHRDSQHLCVGRRVFLAGKGQDFEVTISAITWEPKTVISFEEITSREEASSWVGASISIPRKTALELEEDEFYFQDLVGCKVFSDGAERGEVVEVYSHGAQMIVAIKGEETSWELPYVAHFFPHLDLEKRRIEVIFPQEIE